MALESLLAPKGTVFWGVTILVGAAAAGFFVMASRHRDAIGDAVDQTSRPPPIPERQWSYCARDLEAFIALARSRRTAFGDSALEHYIRPTLVLDAWFAGSLSLFTVLAAVGLGSAWVEHPLIRYLSLEMAGMGLLYGIVDIAEDAKLTAIFSDSERVGDDAARMANMLTRLKFLTICASLIGGLAFLVLAALYRIAANTARQDSRRRSH